MKRTYTSAREVARRELGLHLTSPVGKASDYIKWLCDMPNLPGLRVVLYCRVSLWKQKHYGNLKRQIAHAKAELRKLGVKVIAVFKEANTAKEFDECHRTLAGAAYYAKEHDAILVATATDRYVRHRQFVPKRPDLLPRVHEFEQLVAMTLGVTLATITHPDAPPEEVQGIRSRAGQIESGNNGGRPGKAGYKNRRRKQMKPAAIEMREEGRTLGEIAAKLRIKKSTLQGWLKGVVPGCTVF
jgi:DNA invertase Pin-like site-specific DNA recombinase